MIHRFPPQPLASILESSPVQCSAVRLRPQRTPTLPQPPARVRTCACPALRACTHTLMPMRAPGCAASSALAFFSASASAAACAASEARPAHFCQPRCRSARTALHACTHSSHAAVCAARALRWRPTDGKPRPARIHVQWSTAFATLLAAERSTLWHLSAAHALEGISGAVQQPPACCIARRHLQVLHALHALPCLVRPALCTLRLTCR